MQCTCMLYRRQLKVRPRGPSSGIRLCISKAKGYHKCGVCRGERVSSLVEGKTIFDDRTVPSGCTLLEELLTASCIVVRVAKHFGVVPSTMCRFKRMYGQARNYPDPTRKQLACFRIACYLIYEHTNLSLTDIGRMFIHHHSTIYHHINIVKAYYMTHVEQIRQENSNWLSDISSDPNSGTVVQQLHLQITEAIQIPNLNVASNLPLLRKREHMTKSERAALLLELPANSPVDIYFEPVYRPSTFGLRTRSTTLMIQGRTPQTKTLFESSRDYSES